MRIFTTCCLLSSALFAVTIIFAQPKINSKKIEQGSIVNEATGQPVEGALVILYPGQQSIVADEWGRFSISKSEATTDSIVITAIGYEKKVMSLEEFTKQGNLVRLTTQVIELNAVTVALQPGEQFKIINKLDIQHRDVTNSQEVLRLVPGLFIGQHAGGGKAEQIFLRGFDIDHGTDVNITVDGMPVNMVSHAHGQGYADLHFLIPEMIENVSFNKGPYNAEKGNLATAGYVDFLTRSRLNSNLIKLEAGQFNTFRSVGMIDLLPEKTKQIGQQAFIAGEYMYTRGYFDNPQNFNRENIFGKYRRKMGLHNDLTISASTFTSKWKASGQIPERAFQSGLVSFFGAIDPNEGGNSSRTNINVQLRTMLPNGSYFKNQVFYIHYDFELFSNFTFFLNNAVDGDQIKQKEKRNLFGYNTSYTHVGYAGATKTKTDVGAGFRFDKTHNSELSRTKDRIMVTNRVKLGDINELNTYTWLKQTFFWSKRFTLDAGIRYDRFDLNYKDKLDNNRLTRTNAGIFSPRLNFYYQLNKTTQIYLTTGKGFHSNDTRVAVHTGGKKILPAAYGADLGLVLKPTPDLLFQGAMWYLKLDQEFVYVGDEGVVVPGGQSRRLGVDVSVRYQPVKWLFVDMDANYSNGRAIEEKRGEDYLPLAPVFTSIGGVTYANTKGINAGLRYRYMGNRPANEDYSITAKGYFVTDAVVSYRQQKFEWGISIQNLFDVRWKETQFNTESKLQNEIMPVSEIHFTPGSPFFLKSHLTFYF